MSRQTEFVGEDIKPMSRDLTSQDLEIMKIWRVTVVQCPWCLLASDLWAFATFRRKAKKGKTVNEQKCRCPGCGAEVMRRILLMIYEIEVRKRQYYP